MSAPRPSLLRNMTWLTSANLLVKPLWFVFITAMCMRVLEARGYGIMNTALSFMAIAAAFSDLGTNPYTIREVARDNTAAARFFSNLLLARLALALFAWGLAMTLAWMLGYARPELLALTFAGIYAVALRLTEFCRTFFRAFEILRYESLSLVVEKVLVVAFGGWMLWKTRTPHGTLLGMALGMTLALMLNAGWVHRNLAAFRPALFDGAFVRTAFRTALPLGLSALFTFAYLRIGVILVESIQGEEAAGIYGAAYRLVEALQLLPTVVVAALLPRLSSLFHEGDLGGFRRILRRSFVGAGTLALGAAAVLSVLAPWVIGVLDPSPDFAPAGPLLRLVAWVFPMMTFNYLMVTVLIAADQQRFLAVLFGVVVVLNPILNLVLIPPYSYYGAAIALLASEVIIVVAGALRYRSVMKKLKGEAS